MKINDRKVEIWDSLPSRRKNDRSRVKQVEKLVYDIFLMCHIIYTYIYIYVGKLWIILVLYSFIVWFWNFYCVSDVVIGLCVRDGNTHCIWPILFIHKLLDRVSSGPHTTKWIRLWGVRLHVVEWLVLGCEQGYIGKCKLFDNISLHLSIQAMRFN